MHNRTTEALMLSALVPFQITKLMKSFIATHRITVSPSCEYRGFSKHQSDENASCIHRTRTVSPSCEYACEFANDQND